MNYLRSISWLALLIPLLTSCSSSGIPPELMEPGKRVTETKGLPRDNNHDPSNIILHDGKYYMWYTVHVVTPENSFDFFAHTRIDYVTSSDGFHWEYGGVAIDKGGKGDLDEKGALTAYVVPYENKFYMFYSAIPGYYRPDTVSRRGFTVAVADSPEGPWEKTNNQILKGSEGDEWDNHFVGDAHIIRWKNKWWLYFKGVGIGVSPAETQIGVAISDHLPGPYEKHPANPLIKGHAFSVWKHGKGIAFIGGKSAEQHVFYSTDGLNFLKAGPFPNKSTGLFYPDNFLDRGKNKGILWGVDTGEEGDRRIIYRFDCNIAEP